MRVSSKFLAGLAAASAVLLLAGCATGAKERQSQRLQQVQSVAGEPVRSFHFWNLVKWESLGPEHILVWPRLDTAYLIEVRPPCWGLDYTTVIALSSTQNRVDAKFDKVLFDKQECWIKEIREVDVKALKAAKPAAPSS